MSIYKCKHCDFSTGQKNMIANHVSNHHSLKWKDSLKLRGIASQEAYDKNPLFCKECNKKIPYKPGGSSKRVFCSHSCSALAQNRRLFGSNKPTDALSKREQTNLDKAKAFDDWLSGINNTLLSSPSGEISSWFKKKVKLFLIEEQNHSCKICGQIDIWNGKPLNMILDHIDGDYRNQTRTNLRLVCLHCDSQSDTYCSKNIGRGREGRRLWRKSNNTFN